MGLIVSQTPSDSSSNTLWPRAQPGGG